MHNLSLKEMIDAGVHFGHQTKYWNPKMKPFIFTTYKKLHIINLEKSVEHFNKALEFIAKISKNNSKILFVGTKRAARELIEKHAIDCDMPYVNNRWLGGTLTNFNTVKKSIEKLENYNPKLKCDRNLEESFHSLDYFTSRLGLLFEITLNCPWKLQKFKFRLKYNMFLFLFVKSSHKRITLNIFPMTIPHNRFR